MSNEDFEVHPRGTAEEIKFLRQLAKEIVEKKPHVEELAGKILVFYEYHNEVY
jgi:hypothetical protein